MVTLRIKLSQNLCKTAKLCFWTRKNPQKISIHKIFPCIRYFDALKSDVVWKNLQTWIFLAEILFDRFYLSSCFHPSYWEFLLYFFLCDYLRPFGSSNENPAKLLQHTLNKSFSGVNFISTWWTEKRKLFAVITFTCKWYKCPNLFCICTHYPFIEKY